MPEISHKRALMGHKGKGKGVQMMDQTQVGIVVVGVLIVVGLIGAGIILLILAGLGNVILWFDRCREKEAMKVWRVIETAASLPLSQAMTMLASVGIKYDASAKCHVGRRFVLPRGFWAGQVGYETVSLKTRTLITMATWALENNARGDVLRELVMVMAQQLTKRPGLAALMFSQLLSLKGGGFAGLVKVVQDIDCCQLWRRR